MSEWVKQDGLFKLLRSQADGDDILLDGYAFDGGSVMISSILVPLSDIAGINIERLLKWDGGGLRDSWSFQIHSGGSEPPIAVVARPLRYIGVRELKRGMQLAFSRHFVGRELDQDYYEIAQPITHAHNLHWMPEHQAWSRLDDNGDIEDIVIVEREEGKDGFGRAMSATIRRDVVELHMAATECALVQMFDCTSIPSDFGGYGDGEERIVVSDDGLLAYRGRVTSDPASFFKGVQIILPRESAEDLAQRLAKADATKEYASFIALDFKNGEVREISCAPGATATYFDKGSKLPFETSPAFFNAQVLDKYKADPKKYRIEDRSISCRNSWHLQSYDVNDKNQVHAMLCYLRTLPYSEQLYWKAHNEAPKDSVSKRSFRTDFLGEFDTEHDPIRALKSFLEELARNERAWFTLRNSELVAQLHYPLTQSSKGWGDVIKTLAMCVTEGLEKPFFRKVLESAKVDVDRQLGSIALAEQALTVAGVPVSDAKEVVAPLREIQSLRTKLDAHAGGVEAAGIRAGLLKEHRTPRKHIERLSDRALAALRILAETFDNYPFTSTRG